MASQGAFTDSFHGPNVRAELVCTDQGSRLNLTLARAAGESLPPLAVEADVLWQPLDDSGLMPCGEAISLLHEIVRLIPSADGSRSRGTFWLPRGIARSDLRRCYFRIRTRTQRRRCHDEHSKTCGGPGVEDSETSHQQPPTTRRND